MNIAVILSAGLGSRMKNILPKQFIEIDNKPIFIWTLEKFLNNKNINQVCLVINKDFKDLYIDYLTKFSITNVKLIEGGSTRQESSYKAVKYLKSICHDNDIILLHDGARPLVSEKIINDNIITCQNNQKPSATVINIVDTIVDKEYNLFDRSNMLSVQTPQTFLFHQLDKVHNLSKNDNITNSSDDIQLAKHYGYEINYVNGSRTNIKITEPEDIILFKLFNKEGD